MARTNGERAAAVLLACHLTFLAWVLLWPSAGPAAASVDWTLTRFWNAGFSQDVVTGPRVEFVFNATMLAPVPVLATMAGARWAWDRWTAATFLVCGCVELAQALFLAGRSAQFQDVVSNTVGVLVGSAISHVLMQVLDRRPRRRPSHRRRDVGFEGGTSA